MDELKDPAKDGWSVANGLNIYNYEAEKKMLDEMFKEKHAYLINPGTGSNNSGAVIITPEEMEEIIEVLDQYTRKIRDFWDVNIKKAMDTLSSSWAGAACTQYINLIKGLDKNVQSALKALELLSNTYKAAREKTISMNSTVYTSVNSI